MNLSSTSFIKIEHKVKAEPEDKNIVCFPIIVHPIVHTVKENNKCERKQTTTYQKIFGNEEKIKRAKQVRWSLAEDLRYIKFMKDNIHYFGNEETRRANRIFLKLSTLMQGLRTPGQCKSHHQKMQKVTGSKEPQKIIAYIQQKYLKQSNKTVKSKKHENTQTLQQQPEFIIQYQAASYPEYPVMKNEEQNLLSLEKQQKVVVKNQYLPMRTCQGSYEDQPGVVIQEYFWGISINLRIDMIQEW